MITFNALLRHEGVDPATVQLVRHKDTRAAEDRSPFALWRTDRSAFHLYQSIQSKALFVPGAYVASFVVSPSGDTIFVGLYSVNDIGTAPADTIDPVGGHDVSGLHLYDLRLDDRLVDYRSLLTIDWGKGFLAWVQKAGKNDKPILEIRKTLSDPPFPGFTEFRHDVDTIESIPEAWKEVLRAVKGVYVLVCKETGRLYIGSAKGEESLWGRFSEYAASGHGGNVELKARGRKPYQVSVLEVANTGYGIERLEEAWKRKLMSRELGLNDPVLDADPATIAPFAEIFTRDGFSFGSWSGGQVANGISQIPFVSLSDDAVAFIQAAYDGGWVLESFSWMDWIGSKEARRLHCDPGALVSANPRHIAQLLTTLIRQDRLADGTLLEAFESGLLTRIVSRAVTLTA